MGGVCLDYISQGKVRYDTAKSKYASEIMRVIA